MRLDHLLSKETSVDEIFCCNVLRSVTRADMFSLFNLEGILFKRLKSKNGGLAQLGEHLLCKQGVNGSNPLFSTKWANSSAG